MKNLTVGLCLSWFSLVCVFDTYGTSNTSIVSSTKAWSDTATWQIKSVPGNSNCFDTLLIQNIVYLTAHADAASCASILMLVDDTLRFKAGSKMFLPAGSLIWLGVNGYIHPEGTGNSNQIFIGGVEYWRASDGPISGPTFLDVSYTDINVSHKGGITRITWETALETNNDHFVVEESTNGRDFYEIGKVKGAGNSSKPKKYHFEVHRKMDVPYYYRLVQVDFDGTRNTSESLVLTPGAIATQDINVWMADRELQIKVTDELQSLNLDLMLLDASGREVYSAMLTHDATSTVNLQHMRSGIYYCVIRSEKELIKSIPIALY